MLAEQLQQGCARHRHARGSTHAGASLAAQGKGNRPQALLQPRSAAGVGRGELRQALGEDLTRTGRIGTDEAADGELEAHAPRGPGQVEQGAGVAALHAGRGRLTERAGGHGLRCSDRQRHAIGIKRQMVECYLRVIG